MPDLGHSHIQMSSKHSEEIATPSGDYVNKPCGGPSFKSLAPALTGPPLFFCPFRDSTEHNVTTFKMPGTEPRVGIAALIRNSDGKIVIGKRKGSHGSSKYPGFGASGLLDRPLSSISPHRVQTFA
jgi:hypothetical protein